MLRNSIKQLFENRTPSYFCKKTWGIPLLVAGLLVSQIGCESHSSGMTQTDTKTQVEQLFNLYKSYVNAKRKGPPNEQALREYAKGLSEKQLDEELIAKDVDSIFISARDKQPFQIVYSQSLSPGGEPVAVIYEKTGVKGMKYAALSMGYTEEYDEETLKGYIPKGK